MTFKPTLTLLSTFFLCLSPSASAAVSFSFDYSDPTASAWGNPAKAALNNAAGRIASYLTGYTSTVTIKITGSNTNNSNLASAGSYYTALTPGFSNIGIVGTKIQSNGTIDLNGAGFDGLVNANFFHSWSFGDTVSNAQYDFTNVMMHELSHALGFNSLIAQLGGSVFGSSNTTAQGFYNPFASHVVNGSGTKLVSGTYVTDNAWAVASVGGTGTVPATANSGLYFDGANAVAANGGNLVPLYSPTTWTSGSSGSHLDTNYFTGVNTQLMNSSVGTGIGVRTLSPIEVGVFQDIGYTSFAPIPESSTVVFVLFASSFLMRRKR